MVKGISRQVIVVQAPDPELFEQAIFILKDEAVSGKGVTEEMLLKEAHRLINANSSKKSNHKILRFLWAGTGALVTGLLWLICAFL
ncbi:MAG: hypothetical protein J6Q54_08075 [Oscillospiraceae bacterium]|nr:hypothetical protein [Oscillospiraceae bacterium]